MPVFGPGDGNWALPANHSISEFHSNFQFDRQNCQFLAASAQSKCRSNHSCEANACEANEYGALAAARPICFVYFLAGVEIGIAVIGTVAFAGLQAMRIHGQHRIDQLKNGGEGLAKSR